jgi:hypothetical protein
MPTAEETSHRFGLQPTALRRQQRSLRIALAWYLTGGMILTGFAVWSVGQPAGASAVTLISLSAAQVDYFAYVVVTQLWLIGRDLRRAGTPAGELVLDHEGIRIGREQNAWRDVASVRVRRRGVPHIAVTVRRAGGRWPGGRWPGGRWPGGRRSKRAIRNSFYGVHLDELASAFERYTPVVDAARPRRPAHDDEAGTVTFFFNDWVLRAQRHHHLKSLLVLPVMLGPAAAGLLIVHQPLPAAFIIVVGCGFMVIEWAKVAKLSRLLRISRGGLGRLLLTPEHLKLAGTDVPIPWSHVQGATVARGNRPGLRGTVACPDPEPEAEPRCRFRGRRIPFHIAQSLYCTTPDDIGAAFGRYTRVGNAPDDSFP